MVALRFAFVHFFKALLLAYKFLHHLEEHILQSANSVAVSGIVFSGMLDPPWQTLY